MNTEAKNLSRITGAAGGTGIAVGADQDWLQIIGIIIAALSTIYPILEKIFRKKSDGPGGGGNAALNLLLIWVLGSLGLSFTPGCSTLDPAGVYRGDQLLYQTELSITTSYDVIHSFVSWEFDNRELLAQWPEVKRAADRMRAGAPNWFATAHAAHDAYKANPTDETKTALELSLSILRTALTEATRYMTEAAHAP